MTAERSEDKKGEERRESESAEPNLKKETVKDLDPRESADEVKGGAGRATTLDVCSL